MGNAYKKNFSLQKENTTDAHDKNNIILISNNYIISISLGTQLDIFDIQKKLTKKIKYSSSNYIIKFHPKFENVLLFADGILVRIIEITKDTFEL